MRYRALITLFIFFTASPAFASTYHGAINADVGLPAIVITAPSASPDAGTYASEQSVVLSADGASSIRYTIDGSTPSCAGEGSGTAYVSPVPVSSSLTIQAVSCYSGGDASAAVSFAYGISIPEPPREPASADSGGGGRGNGPIVGSLAQAGGSAPASSAANSDTLSPSAPSDVSPAPVASTNLPPQSDVVRDDIAIERTRAGAHSALSDAVGSTSQLATAASPADESSDNRWLILSLAVYGFADVWWVLDSRNFPKHS